MGEISVNTAELKTLSYEMKSISSNLNTIAESAAETIKKTRKSISDRIAYLIKDTVIVGKIAKCSLDTGSLSSILLDVAAIYERIENSIAEKKFYSDLPSLSDYNLIDEFLDTRNETKDAIMIGLTRGLTDGIKSIIKKGGGEDDFNDEIAKKQILSVINCNDIDLELEKGVIDKLKDLLIDPANNYNDIIKLLEENGEVYKYLKDCDPEYFEKLGKVMKYSSKGVELIDIILSDYSETLAKLEKMRTSLQSVNGDPRIINYIMQLEEDYKNKGSLIIDGVIDLTLDQGIDKTLDLLSTSATGGLLSIATSSHDVIWNVLGLEDKGDALASIYVSNRYSDDLVASYEQQKLKIQSGNYTQEEYENCKSTFELAKSAKIKEYENIREFSTKETQEYIDQKISELKSLEFEL